LDKILNYIKNSDISNCLIYIDKNINIKNIDIVLDELLDYSDYNNEDYIFIINYLKDLKIEFLKEELFITESVDKEPYIKRVSNHLIINLTGESGSGKSTMCKELKNIDAVVIDTDNVFSKNISDDKYSKKLYKFLMDKYGRIPSLFEEFDLCYEAILECFNDPYKLLIIDSAQFRNMKDLSKLKGEVIVLRTCIDTCYNRCIKRFDEKFSNSNIEEKSNYILKKKSIYEWYHKINDFILKVYEL